MGAQEKSAANTSSMQRVKVYRLCEDGKWDDQGTGHVTVDYLERSEDLGLFVIDEEDNETLLLHRINSDDIYRKQEDTIISWREPECSTEFALSFQESTGCSYIWDHICTVQRNMHFCSLNNDTYHSVNSELRELPAVDLSTLPLILKTVVESGITDQMRLTELILNDQVFFRKLMDLFRICEDLENTDGLHMIFKIVKGIILLNSTQIFERIFGDELIMDIIGSLEYDPDVTCIQHHRKFLKEHVVFKEAILINDPRVLSNIHQTYRIGYLKDAVLPRVLDDATNANLNSIIHANNAIVISLLKDDSTFIQELFATLRSPATSEQSKKNLVYFLHEFCSLSKSLQMVQQLRLFRDLVNEGIFDIITDTLQSQDKKLVLTGTDILILFLNQDPNLLRSYVVWQDGVTLLGLLVKGMITDFGDDMHCQFLEILRSLLDSYSLSGSQRDNIIDIFYEKHLGQLIDVIMTSCPLESIAQSSGESAGAGGKVKDQNGVKPEILLNICELLCFCVLHHPYRIKCNFLLHNVIDKVLLLARRREKYIVVAAVQFLRTILTRHDEHLIHHIVKHNLLKPVVEAFVDNGNRYNLLNSAVLELFEYIRKENLKVLLKYIVDSFWGQLAKFDHFDSIHSVKVKYEQSLEICGTKGTGTMLESRKRVDEHPLEKEEEYFNEDSDEGDTASASNSQIQKVQAGPSVPSNGVAASHSSSSPGSGGLVDYEDDEDDEDYQQPPRRQSDTRDEDDPMDSLLLKRKLASKEPERAKKPKESVFAALCSTLSQAVLPSNKKTASAIEDNAKSYEETRGQEPTASGRCSDKKVSDEEDHRDKDLAAPRNCSDVLHSTPDSRQLPGEDHLLIPPQSSPEMTINGS